MLEFGKAIYDRKGEFLCFKNRKARKEAAAHLREALHLLESDKDIFLVSKDDVVITLGYSYAERDKKPRRRGNRFLCNGPTIPTK